MSATPADAEGSAFLGCSPDTELWPGYRGHLIRASDFQPAALSLRTKSTLSPFAKVVPLTAVIFLMMVGPSSGWTITKLGLV